MDVRCERCQTEYELDDASIPEAGVPVQCTTCGYTFSVKRGRDGRTTTARFTPTGTAPPGKTQHTAVTREDLPAAPPTAPWILETEDGKVHRLRDLTTLQKWVVERRVTAADRLSRDGGGLWRELGQVEELAPFFAVVSEADRAKTKSGLAGAPSAQLPNTPSSPPGPSVFAEGNRQRGGPPRLPVEAQGQNARGPGGVSPLEAGPGRERLPPLDDAHDPRGRPAPTMPLAFEDAEELLPPRRNRAPLIVVGLLLLGGAAVGGYYAFGRGEPRPSNAADGRPSGSAPMGAPPTEKPAPATSTKPSGAPEGLVPAPPAPGETEHAPTPAAAPPNAPVAGSPAPTPAPTAATGPGPSAGSPPAPAPEPTGARDETKAAKAPSYERLVAEGDKLLENGQTNRAEKSYVQALALKPDGVSALAGTGYVFLDRGRTQKALDVFQRALALDAGHGPAIFGLAEAYRAQGDVASALNTYKHYLATAPNGADASAARRQVHDLEAAARAGKEPDAP